MLQQYQNFFECLLASNDKLILKICLYQWNVSFVTSCGMNKKNENSHDLYTYIKSKETFYCLYFYLRCVIDTSASKCTNFERAILFTKHDKENII